MKKSLFFALTAILLIITIAAAQQVYSPSQGTVVTSSLNDLWGVLLGVIVWVAKEIFFGAGYVLGMPPSNLNGIIFATIIWILLAKELAKILIDFTSFSKIVAWIIALCITILLAVFGVIKIFGVALLSLISMFTTSTGQILALGILALILVYIILTVIMNLFSSGVKERKREERKVKEKAGRKVLEKIGEEAEK